MFANFIRNFAKVIFFLKTALFLLFISTSTAQQNSPIPQRASPISSVFRHQSSSSVQLPPPPPPPTLTQHSEHSTSGSEASASSGVKNLAATPQNSDYEYNPHYQQNHHDKPGYHEEEKCEALVLYKTKTVHIPFPVVKRIPVIKEIPIYVKVPVKIPYIVKIPVKEEKYIETHYADTIGSTGAGHDSGEPIQVNMNMDPDLSGPNGLADYSSLMEPHVSASSKKVTTSGMRQKFESKNMIKPVQQPNSLSNQKFQLQNPTLLKSRPRKRQPNRHLQMIPTQEILPKGQQGPKVEKPSIINISDFNGK